MGTKLGLLEEHRLKMFANRKLKKIFRPKKEKGTRKGQKTAQ